MMLVLDCSAALELAKPTAAAGFIREAIEETDYVLAPDFYRIEIAAVLRKCVKARQFTASEAIEKARAAIALIDDFRDSSDYYIEALSESIRLDHSAYDMLYFLIARRSSSPLATMDQALGRLCESQGIATLGWQLAQ